VQKRVRADVLRLLAPLDGLERRVRAAKSRDLAQRARGAILSPQSIVQKTHHGLKLLCNNSTARVDGKGIV
jgi:hypothetical protein